MMQLDTNGLRLAEYQAQLFELSYDLECSSDVFLRRFLHSLLVKKLDRNISAIIDLDARFGIDEIEEQYGKSSYGTNKYGKETLFWMGYLYRYMSYTRDIETKLLFKFFPPKKVSELYYVYHTQDMEWCIENLLELFMLDENVFDRNYRLKQVMKRRGKYADLM